MNQKNNRCIPSSYNLYDYMLIVFSTTSYLHYFLHPKIFLVFFVMNVNFMICKHLLGNNPIFGLF